ncbi:MAG: VOC family protein [Myxococcales bacterium]|nr:VOC family protein [Myxococcales bacterium]
MTNSAPIQLGWFSLCLEAANFQETLDFYQALGFATVGGNAEHGYVILGNGPTQITVMSFLQANLICFRGGNVDAISGELAERGFTVYHQAGHDPTSPDGQRVPGRRRYDASSWPAKFHSDEDGNPLPLEGAGDFLIDDPGGHALYFDSVPVERVRYDAGEPSAVEGSTGAYDPDKPKLGRFVYQLRVTDPEASRAFYERLGLQAVKEIPEIGYVELSNGTTIPFTIGLNAKSAPSDVLYFDCEDLASIAAAAEAGGLKFEMPPTPHPDGATTAMLRDPEGNLLYFRQGA